MPYNYGSDSDEETIKRFTEKFALTAGIQGRIAYLLMSVHAPNPNILQCIGDPSLLLYTNMVYGIGILIYTRPNMRSIGFLNRLAFSFLGSLMFNYASVGLFRYIKDSFPGKPRLTFFLGFLSGRVLMLHLLAYLYHVDIRGRDRNVPRNSAFDAMYIN